jgi:hypothetical protein
MTKQEFKKAVEKRFKELLNVDADTMYNKIHLQHQYRNYGINGLSLKDLLLEIAKADILGVDFVDSYNEDDIEELIKDL